MLEQLGGFDEVLTRYNDERDLCRRLRLVGGTILYAPDALVRHRIPADRMRSSTLLRRAYWQGASDVLMERNQEPECRPGLLRTCATLLGQSLADDGRALWALARGRPSVAFLHLFEAVGRLGRLRAEVSSAGR
jgi:hypothetical protein